jgi:flagellin
MKGLLNGAENLQSAESIIRDTNMADEMVNYSKNQILVQSSMAMLSQANAKNQSVLQLLQG